MRALSIISLIFTAVFIGAVIMGALSNGRIDMEEFAPFAFLYGLAMIPLSLIGIIRGGKRKK
jgi:hypothetical protein